MYIHKIIGNNIIGNLESPTSCSNSLEKRKKPRRKPKSRLMESFPTYMQEAFFGRDLLDTQTPRLGSEADNTLPMSDSEGEEIIDGVMLAGATSSTIRLNQVRHLKITIKTIYY